MSVEFRFLALIVALAVMGPLTLLLHRLLQWAKAPSRQRLVFLKGATLAAGAAPLVFFILRWLSVGGQIRLPLSPLLTEPGLSAIRITDTPTVMQNLNWPRALLWIYAAGAVIMLARLLASYVQTRMLLRHAELLSVPRIFVSPRIQTPLSFGLISPRIYVHAGFTKLSTREQELILTHERTHIAHRDHFWKLLSLLARALLYFSPAAHALHRTFETELEIACDIETRHKTCADPREYGGLLLSLLAPPNLPFAVPMAAQSLKRRIRCMKTPVTTRPLVTALAVFIALSVSALAAATSARASLASPTYRVHAQIFVNGRLIATPRFMSRKDETAVVDFTSPDLKEAMSIFVVTTDHPFRGAPGGIRMAFTIQYRFAGETVQSKATMDTIDGNEGEMWVFGKADQPWMEIKATVDRD